MCGHRVGEGNKMESYKIMAWWWKPFTPSPPLYCGWRTIQAEADYWYLQYTARNTFTRTLEYKIQAYHCYLETFMPQEGGRVLFSLANGLMLMTRMTRWCWCWWQWSTELTIWERIPWVGGIYSSRQPFWFGCRLVFSNLNWWLLFFRLYSESSKLMTFFWDRIHHTLLLLPIWITLISINDTFLVLGYSGAEV